MLNRGDQRDGLTIERRMFGRGRRADMRLERDVAEILERDNPELARMVQDSRDRHRHRAQQPRNVHERQGVEIDRPGWTASTRGASSRNSTRKYRRSEASPVRGTTRPRGRRTGLGKTSGCDRVSTPSPHTISTHIASKIQNCRAGLTAHLGRRKAAPYQLHR